MALISQDTDNLRGQGLVDVFDDGLPVALVTIRDGTIFNVFSSPLAYSVGVSDKRGVTSRVIGVFIHTVLCFP
jgi:hypothetical protein